MTGKRFKLGYVCGDFGLIDNDEWIDLHSMSENSEKNVRICINKMNELAEENEDLKNNIGEQGVKLDFAICETQDFKNKWLKLKKENEQLKSRINELEIINEAQSDAIDGLQETMCHLDLSELNGDVE